MNVKISSKSKIFIACPANVATGGPELLHQLAFNLRINLNIESFMYYYNFNNEFKIPVHPEYEIYNTPYVLEIIKKDDKQENILIVPEILPALSLLNKFQNIKKGVWFLSVDNYYFSKITKNDFFFYRALNKIIKLLKIPPVFDVYSQKNLEKLAVKYDYKDDNLLKLADFYMTNSYRGLQWFKKLKPIYLSEYLNLYFLKTQTDLSKKENIVAYNPNKGFQFTNKIMGSAKDIEFIPLINMTREEVIKTLQKAKVYIDFGNHPGKDRMPREAAMLRCCVITGKRGSAAYFEDMPIPEEYKFDDKKKYIPKIVEKIKDCFENFEKRYEDFDYYRQVIKNEPQKFIEDLKNIF